MKITRSKKFIMKFRYKYLLRGSKETVVGILLVALFPTVYAYILLLSGIISEFKINIYGHTMFFLSFLFIIAYSFFNEVLYDSHEDMNFVVFMVTLGTVISLFITAKLPF